MYQSVVLGQLSRVARLSWGLATLEYHRLVVSSPIKNIDFGFGRPFLFPFQFPFPRFYVFQLPEKNGGSRGDFYTGMPRIFPHPFIDKRVHWLIIQLFCHTLHMDIFISMYLLKVKNT